MKPIIELKSPTEPQFPIYGYAEEWPAKGRTTDGTEKPVDITYCFDLEDIAGKESDDYDWSGAYVIVTDESEYLVAEGKAHDLIEWR